MDREQVKAIELQGIVRNQTKIGIQDGQCEDIMNLRFKDGSWRAAGKGKLVHSNGTSYEQMYVHTNVYHHLLGVNNGTLYWFANIDKDCVTFKALDTPMAITNVTGTVSIVQTGHLLTIIDEADEFEYVLFKTADDKYITVNAINFDKQGSRELFPFGQIHFNWSDGESIEQNMKGESGWNAWAETGASSYWWDLNDVRPYLGDDKITKLGGTIENCQNKMIEMYGKATDKNLFTDPFLVCAAIKLYDGSYIYASNPVLIFPHQKSYTSKRFTHKEPTNAETSTINWDTDELTAWLYNGDLSAIGYDEIDCDGVFSPCGGMYYQARFKNSNAIWAQWLTDVPIDLTSKKVGWTDFTDDKTTYYHARLGGRDVSTVFSNGIYNLLSLTKTSNSTPIWQQQSKSYWAFKVQGCNLCVSVNKNFLADNSDIFTSLCIFVTPQSSIYYRTTNKDDQGEHRLTVDNHRSEYDDGVVHHLSANLSYSPKRRTIDEIKYDLLNSKFYLLKEYDAQQLDVLINNPIVDLSSVADKGLLSNITEQTQLEIEGFFRDSYNAKVHYMYNGRLHIANYKKSLFHGYPIDTLQLNNHSLKYKKGEWFNNTLPNLISDYDDVIQYKRNKVSIGTSIYGDSTELYNSLHNNHWFLGATIQATLVTVDGESKVVKYIDATHIPLSPSKGDFQRYIEELDPIIFYPDYRATSIDIRIITVIYQGDYHHIVEWHCTLPLTPHPYLNIAYYATKNLSPITMSLPNIHYNGEDINYNGNLYKWMCYPSLASSDMITIMNEIFSIPQDIRSTEYYPNGLKVSKTNNPLYFPVENTYQVGSAEIIALMSNAVAIGTGQTGAAPLYVFCKDGVYALLVDEKGEMAYTNSRIIARDVCNNAKSVTPIDTGVVFTTDRGLMSIAGNEVQEIGQIAEGDVFDYSANSTTDKAKKIMHNAFTMKKLADLPKALLDNVDFLTFLKGSIINYNHNERELMVSNNEKDANGNRIYNYSFIMDRHGNWSRRDIAADEYVNNYPTSYRVQDNNFYKVDEEDSGRDTSDNSIYAMSQVVKLDSIGFKELHRVVARGYFETIEGKKVITSGNFYGQDTANAFIMVQRLYSKKDKINFFGREIKDIVGRKFELRIKNNYGSASGSVRFGLAIKTGDDETVYGKDILTEACRYGEENTKQFDFGVKGVISPYYNATSIYLYAYSGDDNTPVGSVSFDYSFSEVADPYLGLYLFGSYDGRKWALLGHREKQGKFTDIGSVVERTDCRFFRFVLAGQISKDSRLDYFEVSAGASKLNTKIR